MISTKWRVQGHVTASVKLPGMCWYALISRPPKWKRDRCAPWAWKSPWIMSQDNCQRDWHRLGKSENCAVLSIQELRQPALIRGDMLALPAANVIYVTLTSKFWLRRHLWATAAYGRDESVSWVENSQSVYQSVNWFSRWRWRVFHQATDTTKG